MTSESTPIVKILCIERGLAEVPGLLTRVESFLILNPALPHSKGDGLEVLAAEIESFQPDLVLAMCRGAWYALHLITQGLWRSRAMARLSRFVFRARKIILNCFSSPTRPNRTCCQQSPGAIR